MFCKNFKPYEIFIDGFSKLFHRFDHKRECFAKIPIPMKFYFMVFHSQFIGLTKNQKVLQNTTPYEIFFHGYFIDPNKIIAQFIHFSFNFIAWRISQGYEITISQHYEIFHSSLSDFIASSQIFHRVCTQQCCSCNLNRKLVQTEDFLATWTIITKL